MQSVAASVEVLETQLVNAVAPFVLNARLKPLLLRTPERDKHIVNVSAVEGQFYRRFKTTRHPHTNMAKAALNMLTRTSAQEMLENDGILMTAVDTGWITDERPHTMKKRLAEDGFHAPLDLVDGAARV
jgi:NAD(P)-dependent dehydrogenase (short-subunit alcohol dehydrogenase family)